MNLRALARNRECQIRLPGICNFDPATTVLAHVRMSGISGMGLKSPDFFGAWACSACHDAVDRRTSSELGPHVRLALLEGMVRTQYALIKEGVIRT